MPALEPQVSAGPRALDLEDTVVTQAGMLLRAIRRTGPLGRVAPPVEAVAADLSRVTVARALATPADTGLDPLLGFVADRVARDPIRWAFTRDLSFDYPPAARKP